MATETNGSALALRPTRWTLFLRSCILWQLWRFVVINLRMTVMIVKSHHTRIAPSEAGHEPGRRAPGAAG